MNSQYCPITYLGEQKHLKKEEVQNRPFPIKKQRYYKNTQVGTQEKSSPSVLYSWMFKVSRWNSQPQWEISLVLHSWNSIDLSANDKVKKEKGSSLQGSVHVMSNSCFLFTPTVFTLIIKSSVLKSTLFPLGRRGKKSFENLLVKGWNNELHLMQLLLLYNSPLPPG